MGKSLGQMTYYTYLFIGSLWRKKLFLTNLGNFLFYFFDKWGLQSPNNNNS